MKDMTTKYDFINVMGIEQISKNMLSQIFCNEFKLIIQQPSKGSQTHSIWLIFYSTAFMYCVFVVSATHV